MASMATFRMVSKISFLLETVTTQLALVSLEYHHTGQDHSLEHQEKHDNAEDPGFGHIAN